MSFLGMMIVEIPSQAIEAVAAGAEVRGDVRPNHGIKLIDAAKPFVQQAEALLPPQ